MEVYLDNIKGNWRRQDTGAIYRFYASQKMIVQFETHQLALEFEIITKQRDSMLRIDKNKYPFVVMNPGARIPYFILSTKKGLITFERLEEK